MAPPPPLTPPPGPGAFYLYSISRSTLRFLPATRTYAHLVEHTQATKPEKGTNPLAVAPRKSSEKGLAASLVGVRKFKDMPLSGPTQRSLADSRFKELTAIQRATIPHALAGRDILGAAKTGSGKTLAFIIPTLEALYRAKWGRQDGLGGLVIAPTRELAMQIFQQLLAAGKHHSFSAAGPQGGALTSKAVDPSLVVES